MKSLTLFFFLRIALIFPSSYKMNNNSPKLTHSQQQNLNKLPRIEPLNSEQLDVVAGGPGTPTQDRPPPRMGDWKDKAKILFPPSGALS